MLKRLNKPEILWLKQYFHSLRYTYQFSTCCSTLHQQKNAKHHFVPKSKDVDENDVNLLSDFINQSERLFVITGAGISTESGIRDYRSEGVGLYATSTHRPIQYQDFLKHPLRRKRYWARNFAGWHLFSSFQPNVCHDMLADMENYGNLHWLVTQNVDSLHRKAGSKKLTELHGAGARVGCINCGHEVARDTVQQQLLELNKNWYAGNVLDKQGPDGDVIIEDDKIESFQMINCVKCDGILKPKIVFFGDNVDRDVKTLCYDKLLESDALLVIGSSLQVYSSFRFIITATEQKKPIAILNIGETRGDRFSTLKITAQAGRILPKLKLKYSNEILLDR